ncbi:hypothetical protein FRC09_005515 [Ceratobasidium sp. 395]|nr:hypothetical protein FRC09_005515 [Ceratobasidium sp. 395]
MDSHDGPVKSLRQVALYETDDADYPKGWIDDEHGVNTEVIRTDCDRESNYVHAGWSLSAISNLSPWVLLRSLGQKQASQGVSWVTKRTTIKKRTISISPEELRPCPEFEADIRNALNRLSNVERFQAVHKAFIRWGDVVPLIKVYELGTSLTVTDTERHAEQGLADYWWLSPPNISKLGREAIRGGSIQTISKGDIKVWRSQELPAHEWRMVRVLRVMSTIDLLERELRERLAALHACILTFNPPGLDGRDDIHRTWDDTLHALKTMSRVITRGEVLVNGVSIEYADGSQSNAYGKGKHEHVFSLASGEYISDVIVCENPWDVHAIQFVTTRGRVSPFYGGDYGGLKILNSDDGVLAGLTGRIKTWEGSDVVARIQTIWRRDIPRVPHTPSGRQAIYIGGPDGIPLSDWPYNPAPHTAYISRVDVQCEDAVRGIQMTYTQKYDDGAVVSQAPCRGKSEGEKHSFELAPDEYIVAVSGNQTDTLIVRICFYTNKGRTSGHFGGNTGTAFMSQPQTTDGKSMRLAFVIAKAPIEFRGDNLHGLLLVWMPV